MLNETNVQLKTQVLGHKNTSKCIQTAAGLYEQKFK